jgi:hypothetical protein
VAISSPTNTHQWQRTLPIEFGKKLSNGVCL